MLWEVAEVMDDSRNDIRRRDLIKASIATMRAAVALGAKVGPAYAQVSMSSPPQRSGGNALGTIYTGEIIEGPFARNPDFLTCLAAATERPAIVAAGGATDTAVGAPPLPGAPSRPPSKPRRGVRLLTSSSGGVGRNLRWSR